MSALQCFTLFFFVHFFGCVIGCFAQWRFPILGSKDEKEGIRALRFAAKLKAWKPGPVPEKRS